MSEILSLAYFDAIFAARSQEYRDLLETLIQMSREYSMDYARVVLGRDEEAFKEVRHRNVTFLENLELKDLKELQLQAKTLVADQASDQVLQMNVEKFRWKMDEVRRCLEEVLEKEFPR